MDPRARSADSALGRRSKNEFGSLSLAQAYIDAVRERISSLGADELIDALEGLDRAYDEFPELEFDRPRGELLDGLRCAAETMPDRTAIPLLMYCVVAEPCRLSSLSSLFGKITKAGYWSSLSAVLRLLYCPEFCWRAVEPVVTHLLQQGRHDAVVQLISEVLAGTKFANEASSSAFGDVLKRLLTDQRWLGTKSALLAQAVWTAGRRLSRPSPARREPRSRAELLAIAERLRPTLSLARLNPYPDLGWPSSRMSFEEFLLQWPCEVELPLELDETALIEEAYRAILLREPDIAERDQYLKLLRNGIVSKSWIIEDLLASKELRSLERRVRVNWGGRMITESGNSAEEKFPSVTWPWRSPAPTTV